MGLFKTTNHYTSNSRTVAPAYPQTVHEHRAPTDDSVKILREMEGAAQESILDAYEFTDNGLTGIVVLLKARDPLDFDHRKLYVCFTLNGKKHQFVEKMDSKHATFDQRAAYERLIHGVRNALLEQLLPHIEKALINDW